MISASSCLHEHQVADPKAGSTVAPSSVPSSFVFSLLRTPSCSFPMDASVKCSSYFILPICSLAFAGLRCSYTAANIRSRYPLFSEEHKHLKYLETSIDEACWGIMAASIEEVQSKHPQLPSRFWSGQTLRYENTQHFSASSIMSSPPPDTLSATFKNVSRPQRQN